MKVLLMKAGSRVKLTKLGSQRPGLVEDGHWTLGILLRDVEVGESVLLAREARAAIEPDEVSPVVRPGVFESSTVMRIAGNLIATRNSFWLIEAADSP